MFALQKLEMENFKSYAGKHAFEFPNDPGLYNLTGQNLKFKTLGANGTGKSSLLDAVCWCLYGRTARGVRAGNVLTRQARGVAAVALTLTVGQLAGVVRRTHGPNSLTLATGGKPKAVSQAELEAFIRLSFDEFIYSVIRPQGVESFFDLGATDKLNLFSKIMKLDYWLERSEEAKAFVGELKVESTDLTAKIRLSEGVIEQASSDIEALTVKQQEFEAEQSKRAEQLRQRRQAYKKDLSDTEKQIKSNQQALQGLEIRLTKAESRAKASEEAADQARSDRQRLMTAEALATAAVERLQGEFEALQTLKGACPTCKQPISQQSHKKHMNQAWNSLRVAQDALSAAKVENSSAGEALAKAKIQLSRCLDDMQGIKKNIGDFRRELDRAEAKAAHIRDELNKIAPEKEQAPFASMIEDKKRLILAEKKKIKVNKLKREETDSLCEATAYWVDGFKRVRLFIVEDTLRQLEIEINNNLTSLGLTEWQVKLDVERETKSGGITKGFSVFIFVPGNDDPVQYETYSGGETQRLRLAGDMGLANLILAQAGLVSAIEFWDEASSHLSQEGQRDLAETLDERSERLNKAIFMVDHNNLDYGGFRGTYTTVMTDEGSSIKIGRN